MIKFTKEDKNKVRKFYRDLLIFVDTFIQHLEERYHDNELNEVRVLETLKAFRIEYNTNFAKN